MYTLLSTGDVPGASSYFNPLVQQSLIPTTSGGRPTPSHQGMTVYETDTKNYSHWTGSAWQTALSMQATNYTSTLTVVSGTNPTLGTGGTAQGRYTIWNGKWCAVYGTIRFGTSGAVAGSGSYQIAMPFTSSAAGLTAGTPFVGSVALWDNSASNLGMGVLRLAASSNQAVLTAYGNSTFGSVTDAGPWVWANNDFISFSIVFEIV